MRPSPSLYEVHKCCAEYEDELEREQVREWKARIQTQRRIDYRKQHAHHEVTSRDLMRTALVCAGVVLVLGYWLWRAIYG